MSITHQKMGQVKRKRVKLVRSNEAKSINRHRSNDNNFIKLLDNDKPAPKTGWDDWLGNMIADRERHTPKTGYNLVGIDCFEEPGQQLYLIEHFDTYAAARKAQKKYGEKHSVIYEPSD